MNGYGADVVVVLVVLLVVVVGDTARTWTDTVILHNGRLVFPSALPIGWYGTVTFADLSR
jgi:hypothetical protein